MGIRRFWAASDGNGGYDIGEGDFTVASVRHLKFQDGAKVSRAYEMAMGEAFNPRATAMLFRAAPDLLAALDQAESFIAGFEDDELQEGIDGMLAAIRAAIAKAKGEA